MAQLPPIEKLIERLRKNECTPEELQLVKQWISEMELPGVAAELSPELLATLKAAMHQSLMQKIRSTPVVAMQSRSHVRRSVAAAAILLLVASGAVGWLMLRRTGGQEGRRSQALTVVENNKKNIVQQVTLPDGTLVWLNRYSRLEFDPQQFNKTQRYVKLSGEGFFEVVRDTTKPFIVATGQILTRVLGTSFNVEAYQQESEISVSLVHGKVALDDTGAGQTTILEPNQTARYSKKAGGLIIKPMAVSAIDQWRNGQLVFNELLLSDAIERIKERYELDIQYDPLLLKDKRITASFSSGPWSAVLQNILFVHELEYKVTGNTIVIIKTHKH